MDKRLITKRQEQIFRCCHHDFGGLSQVEAAKKLGITQSAVSNALAACRKTMPQMFPIFTKLETRYYKLYTIKGWSIEKIANNLGKSRTTVYEGLERMRDKGMSCLEIKGRILSYDSSMDAEIKHKF